MNSQSICHRLSIRPSSSSTTPFRTLLHPLAFIIRPALKPGSWRSYSRKGSPPPSTEARPTLTLDDVLPAASPASVPTPPSASSPDFASPQAVDRFGPRYDRSNRAIEPNQSRYPPRSFGAMRPPLDLSSDPIRRRSGERTIYSLLVRSTSNNTRLTLTHTPLAHLPGSWPGNTDYQKAFPMAGAVVARVTAGSVGFKRGKRQEYEAATQATLAMFAKIRELVSHGPDPNFSGIGALLGTSTSSVPTKSGLIDVTKRAVKEGLPRELEIVFDGFGNGRDAFVSSLMGAAGTGIRELVRAVRDKTVVKIGGPRPKKRRRV